LSSDISSGHKATLYIAGNKRHWQAKLRHSSAQVISMVTSRELLTSTIAKVMHLGKALLATL